LQRTRVPVIAFVLLVVAATWSLWVNRRGQPRRHVFVGAAAVAVALSPIPTAIAAAMKLGGNFNQYSGPVWTTTLGGSVLLVLLRPSLRQLTAATLAC